MTPRALALALCTTGLLLSGCASSQPPLTQLSLEVKPSGQTGIYRLSGTANLPEGTPLTIQGIRLLNATEPGTSPAEAQRFSILDRKIVQVTEGRWETSLEIWDSDPDGNPAETWQIHLPGGINSFQADPMLRFTATTPPSQDGDALEQQWEASQNNSEGQQVGFTAEGRWYLQAGKQLMLEPPNVSQSAAEGGTAAIAIWRNQGGSEPLEIDPAIPDPSLEQPLTDAGLAPAELLR